MTRFDYLRAIRECEAQDEQRPPCEST